MTETWRLIPRYDGTGAEQMAIDSWLLDQHIKGLQPPCLRFYTWLVPTLSLGYHQRQFPDYWHTLQWQGQPIALVRRPTGGRAVLHQGDLTYALIMSVAKGSRREVYQQLCQFLIEGWQQLGIALSFGVAGRGYIHNPNCFGTATAADLVMENGYKLIGSAQVYRQGCVLQHGSMRLQPKAELFEQVFGEKIEQSALLTVLRPLASLMGSGDEGLCYEAITAALAEAASQCFEVEFEVRSLTPTEIKSAVAHHDMSGYR
ncbi:MAG: lipoate--protein ligase family protein [Phormidesmis sp. RL_2_1]|nr:lipoate--protein ligase family protein [Phormidesmis sp. RL_2_1]